MDATAGIFAAIADPKNAAVLAIALAVMTVLIKLAPPGLDENSLYVRLLPVYPVPLCMGIVWIPGLSATAALTTGDKIALGAALGIGLAWSFKVWRQTVLGKDERIEKAKAIKNGDILK